MGQDKTEWDGIKWDKMRWNRMGWERTGWNKMRWDGIAWHGMAKDEKAQDGKHSPAVPACRAQLQIDVNLSQLLDMLCVSWGKAQQAECVPSVAQSQDFKCCRIYF